MSRITDIKEWLRMRSNNQRIALVAGMERQASKLPEGDPRTLLIQARIAKMNASIDWTAGLKEKEDDDGSDSE